MFSILHRPIPKQQSRWQGVSLTAHGLFLAFLLHVPTPTVIAPSSALAGENGTSVTQLYWPNRAATVANSKSSAERARRQRVMEGRLTWNRRKNQAKARPPDASVPTPAGSQYGSLYGGSFGHEVRPALPVLSAEPVVSPADLVGGIEGSVVVEITIDEKGNIVDKVLVQGLRPAIDAKVLAALENWHFSPATRDGVAIPSKQDVYYHFKPN